MKHVLVPTALCVGMFALSPIAGAAAATAYMNGLGGTAPGYSTITGPNGERVNTSWEIFGGTKKIGWDNVSQQSAVREQIKWLEAHQNEDNTLWVYSATANSINKVAAQRPELLARTTVIAIAPPKSTSLDYAPVPTPSTFRQHQVIADGDSVADEDGTNFNTHLNGYKNLNLQTQAPVSSTTLNNTNTTRSYYAQPVKKVTTYAERKAARQERREASKQRWNTFLSSVFKKPSQDSSAPANDAPTSNDTDTSE